MDCPKTKAACLYPVNCDDYDTCLRSLGYAMSSQPNPTPQVPAAPTLEQLADSEFELWQDDCWMAGTSGPRETALAEIMHYAMVYGEDGPVKVYEVKRTLIPHE